MRSVWPGISLERESYWILILRISSSQCHSNPVLFLPCKTPDPVKDLYDGHTYDLKTGVDVWIRIDVFQVEYGTFAQTFHLMIWFFQIITRIDFKWYYVLWCIIDLLALIVLWKNLRIYKVTPDLIR